VSQVTLAQWVETSPWQRRKWRSGPQRLLWLRACTPTRRRNRSVVQSEPL